MRTVVFAFLTLATSPLFAQGTDTTEVKNGVFWIYETGKNGRPVGEGAAYDTTGRLVGRETYRRGLTHGQSVWYDGRGRKTWTVSYVKGLRHGIAIQYDSLDRKIHSITFRKGVKHGPEIYYHPNGRVQISQRYRTGVLHGPSATYHANGKVEWTKAYRDGKLHGERILRDSTGALVDGEYVTWYPMRRGQYTVACVNGRPHGKVTAHLADGRAAYTGNYSNGLPDGEWIFFDKEGKVWRKEYYIMGKFERSTQGGGKGGYTPGQYPLQHPEEW